MCEEQVLLNRFLPEIQLCCARPARNQSSAAPPFTEIKKKTVEAAHGDQSLISLQRYRIIKQARGRHLNLKKTVRTVNIIAAGADDQQIGTRSLHAAHGV